MPCSAAAPVGRWHCALGAAHRRWRRARRNEHCRARRRRRGRRRSGTHRRQRGGSRRRRRRRRVASCGAPPPERGRATVHAVLLPLHDASATAAVLRRGSKRGMERSEGCRVYRQARRRTLGLTPRSGGVQQARGVGRGSAPRARRARAPPCRGAFEVRRARRFGRRRRTARALPAVRLPAPPSSRLSSSCTSR